MTIYQKKYRRIVTLGGKRERAMKNRSLMGRVLARILSLTRKVHSIIKVKHALKRQKLKLTGQCMKKHVNLV